MTAKRALLAWGILSILVLASLLGIWLWRGPGGFEIAIQRGPYTNLQTALASVTITWLLGGSFLYLFSSKRLHSKNIFTYAGFFLVALVYLNLLRERTEYGDVEYYIDAALKLSAGQALPNEYFYPPLWATLLAWLVPLGEDGIFFTVWLLNLFSLLAFYFLLSRTLQLYGFSAHLAALVTTGFMLANAPVLRTLVYMQVNLHVMNAVLLSLLLYRRFPAISALMMAIAVHLKASPAVLVLAFLLEWNWRWLAWAALSFLVVGAIPVFAHGFSPYLDFIQNTFGLAGGHALHFRESSFDGFFTALGGFLNLSPASGKPRCVSCQSAPVPCNHACHAQKHPPGVFLLRGGYSALQCHAFPAHPDADGFTDCLGAPWRFRGTLVPGIAQQTGQAFRLGIVWIGLLPRIPAANLRLLPLVLRAVGRTVDLSVADVAGNGSRPIVRVRTLEPLAGFISGVAWCACLRISSWKSPIHSYKRLHSPGRR